MRAAQGDLDRSMVGTNATNSKENKTMNTTVRKNVDGVKTFRKVYAKNGTTYRLLAKVRYGDALNNGHNTLAVTADLDRKAGNGQWIEDSGGCIHDLIAKHFPQLKDAIRFHLVSTDGPTHYPQNALFFAGQKDCWGRAPGDPSRTSQTIRFGDNPIRHYLAPKFLQFLRDDTSGYDFKVIAVPHGRDNDTFKPKFTVGGYAAEWHTCPFDTEHDAIFFVLALQNNGPAFDTIVVERSEGKAPELESARAAANWPDATLEQLNDKDVLLARLPAMLAEFQGVVESFGFKY